MSYSNCSWYFQFYSAALFVELSSSTQLYSEFIQIVLDTSSSILQRVSSILLLKLRQQVSSVLQWVSSTLQRISSTLSASQLNSAASMLNSAESLLSSISGSCHFFAYLLCEKSLSSVGPFILHTPWTVALFCTLHSVQERPLYPVLRVYTTLYTLDSALLCNSEILYCIVILWLCTAFRKE